MKKRCSKNAATLTTIVTTINRYTALTIRSCTVRATGRKGRAVRRWSFSMSHCIPTKRSANKKTASGYTHDDSLSTRGSRQAERAG